MSEHREQPERPAHRELSDDVERRAAAADLSTSRDSSDRLDDAERSASERHRDPVSRTSYVEYRAALNRAISEHESSSSSRQSLSLLADELRAPAVAAWALADAAHRRAVWAERLAVVALAIAVAALLAALL